MPEHSGQIGNENNCILTKIEAKKSNIVAKLTIRTPKNKSKFDVRKWITQQDLKQ